MRKTIICDIDGTIANVDHRVHLIDKSGGVDKTDWDAFYSLCGGDAPIAPIIDLLQEFNNSYDIVFMTGRRGSVGDKTTRWLYDNIPWLDRTHNLIMRKPGDLRHDTLVKPESAIAHGLTPDKVAFILEDRNSMVKKWRELGYTCLQVAEGDF